MLIATGLKPIHHLVLDKLCSLIIISNMSNIVTMSQTVGELLSGSTYRVRSKNALTYVANSQATILLQRRNADAITGKRG